MVKQCLLFWVSKLLNKANHLSGRKKMIKPLNKGRHNLSLSQTSSTESVKVRWQRLITSASSCLFV